jgi:hypothetical protein
MKDVINQLGIKIDPIILFRIRLHITAIYDRNLNHKILADITMLGESFVAQILARDQRF